MGGSGVIEISCVQARKELWSLLSRLLDYPQADFFTPANRQLITASTVLSSTEQTELTEIYDQLAAPSQLQRESHYADLFELNRRYTLYMSYYKMSDSRERGTVLAKLKMLYEMFGVAEATSELADYLPVMLEFFAYADFSDDERLADLQLAINVIEDGTYALLQRAASNQDDPYLRLVKLTRQLIKDCLAQIKEESHV